MAVLRKVDITKPKKAKLVKKRKDLAAQIFHNSLKGLQISQKISLRFPGVEDPIANWQFNLVESKGYASGSTSIR